MEQNELIPHLFRTEYQKIVAVLSRLFGIEHIETAEDIVSDTFSRPLNYGASKDYHLTQLHGSTLWQKIKRKII